MCQNEVVEDPQTKEPSMEKLIRIGIDTSKSVFQLHGVNAAEQAVVRKKLRRAQLAGWLARQEPTLVGLEACGASHHWARALAALGHEVVLIPPQHCKPYVSRGKNDKADAEAICEAMSRPKVARRFVPVKSVEQQALLMMVTTRQKLIARRTQLSNTIRGHAAEFGFVAPKGLRRIAALLGQVRESEIPDVAKQMFGLLKAEYVQVEAHLRQAERALMSFHRQNELSRRLAEVPGIGPIGATLLVAKVANPKAYKTGRDFSAWAGLTPRDHSTAGKLRLGGITRAGDEAIRSVLVQGATTVIQHVKRGHPRNASPWLSGLVARKPAKLAAVALANKSARIAWKLMVSGERYNPRKTNSLPTDIKAAA
jgi:transposase